MSFICPPKPTDDNTDCTGNKTNFGLVNNALPLQIYLQTSQFLVNDPHFFHYIFGVFNYMFGQDARLIQPKNPGCFWQVLTIQGIPTASVSSTSVGMDFYDANDNTRAARGNIGLAIDPMTAGGWVPTAYNLDTSRTVGDIRACSICNFSTTQALSMGYKAAFVAIYVYSTSETNLPSCATPTTSCRRCKNR